MNLDPNELAETLMKTIDGLSREIGHRAAEEIRTQGIRFPVQPDEIGRIAHAKARDTLIDYFLGRLNAQATTDTTS